jgi:hypothetical protein
MWKYILTRQGGLLYSINVVFHIYAALAQSVERRLGKAEVGGSIPLGSSEKRIDRDFLKVEALESLYFK